MVENTDFVNDYLSDIKDNLITKWLDYYEENHQWIVALNIHKERGWSQTVDSVQKTLYRPSGQFILPVISALEVRLSKILPYLLTITTDKEKLIGKLGLDFDPEIAIAERNIERLKEQKYEIQLAKIVPLSIEGEKSVNSELQTNPDIEYLNQIRQDMNQ